MSAEVYSRDEFTRRFGGDVNFPNPPAGLAAVLVNVGSVDPVVMLIDLHDESTRTVVFEDGKVMVRVDSEPRIEVLGPNDTLSGPPPCNTVDDYAQRNPEVQKYLRAGKKIQAIKELRSLSNAGLKEAKDAVDRECSRLTREGVNIPTSHY